jgi:hypothetical protein
MTSNFYQADVSGRRHRPELAARAVLLTRHIRLIECPLFYLCRFVSLSSLRFREWGILIVNARDCTADNTLEKRLLILCPVAWTDIRAAVRTASRSPRCSFARPRSLRSKHYNCNSHRFR